MGYAASSRGNRPEAPRIYFEIVVFLPDEGGDVRPTDIARTMATDLNVGSAELGVDALTGAVEMRLLYDPSLFVAAREYLQAAGVVFEVDRR